MKVGAAFSIYSCNKSANIFMMSFRMLNPLLIIVAYLLTSKHTLVILKVAYDDVADGHVCVCERDYVNESLF